MKSKKIISVFLIYFIPFIFSSCFCDCSDEHFEMTYTGLELKTWDTRGFENTEISSSIPMDSFGLTIYLSEETKQVANIKSKFNMNPFGFTSAYAVVDCFCESELTIKDPINSIIIAVKNTETNERTDISNNFNSHEDKSINELLAENIGDFHDQFNLDLIKYENIPNSSIFTVIVTLDSGIELIKQTETVIFE
ncbi:hypothetical protein ACFLRU_07080 [Bacteroidota bacterium]